MAQIDPSRETTSGNNYKTIDSYDMDLHRQHARNVWELERTFSDLHIRSLDEARGVQPHTWVESLEVQVPMIDLLTGFFSPERKTIAFFTRPFSSQRRSPFSFFQLAPSLGDLDEQYAISEKLKNHFPSSGESEGKKAVDEKRFDAVVKAYNALENLNSWLLEIKGRQSQYQKG